MLAGFIWRWPSGLGPALHAGLLEPGKLSSCWETWEDLRLRTVVHAWSPGELKLEEQLSPGDQQQDATWKKNSEATVFVYASPLFFHSSWLFSLFSLSLFLCFNLVFPLIPFSLPPPCLSENRVKEGQETDHPASRIALARVSYWTVLTILLSIGVLNHLHLRAAQAAYSYISRPQRLAL